jgi:hypothetical protein
LVFEKKIIILFSNFKEIFSKWARRMSEKTLLIFLLKILLRKTRGLGKRVTRSERKQKRKK